MKTEDTFLDPMRTTLNRNLLKWAVGRAMFCPDCENMLDYKRAVLVSIGEKHGISCASCFDTGIGSRFTAEKLEQAGAEVIDGRKLSARKPRARKAVAQ